MMAQMGTEEHFSPARILVLTAGLSVLGGLAWGLHRHSLASGLSLTGTGALAMINFRWLELILSKVLQGSTPSLSTGAVLRFVGRMLVLAFLLAALVWIPSVDGVGVALGYSTLVVSLIVEALRN